MKFVYRDANNILIDAFPEMKIAYDNNVDEYLDLPYAFYESEFVPYIMHQLQENNLQMLKRIFDFVEGLFTSGDEMIVNLAGVAIVESLFFEEEYSKYETIIQDFYGMKTRQSFSECAL